MKHFTPKKLILGATLALMATGVSAGIVGGKHDMTAAANATAGYVTAIGTAASIEICVFCHTPHGGNQSIAPLWNRIQGNAALFSTYSSSSIDGTSDLGGISLACLSCHDGATARDTMINAPGSGNFNSTTGVVAGYVWNNSNVMAAGVIGNLGTDLTNDHPISIQYAGGGFSAADTDAVPAGLGDGDFNSAQYAGGTSNNWWVDVTGGGAGTRDKTDMILYARDVGSGDGIEAIVECASCHDPHSSNVTFLRTVNTGSVICLACHDK